VKSEPAHELMMKLPVLFCRQAPDGYAMMLVMAEGEHDDDE